MKTLLHVVYLQKVDHTILLSKLNDWFKSYFCNRKQFVSINGVQSDEAHMKIEYHRLSSGTFVFLFWMYNIPLCWQYNIAYY